ncbi:MAG: hypothetical protein V7637_2930 [Mycobacteriales bacterium]|jgi:hypothetical protein
MRYQRAGIATAVLAAAAACLVSVAGPAQAGLVTSCTGTASDVTVPGDLFVPAGESCELTNVTVNGNTTVRADANLILKTSNLTGTLTVAGNGYADLTSSTVAGATRLNSGFGLNSQSSTFTGNVTVTGSGFAYSVGSTFAGNITSTSGETYLQSGRVARNIATTGDQLTDMYDTVVGGKVTVADAALGSVVCTSEIDGDTSFSGAGDAGVVQIGAQVPVSGCGFDVFAAGLTLAGNHAPITISDNVVRGVLACMDNDAAPTGSGNRLRGGATGQCAGLAGSAAAATASSKAAGATAATDRAAGILAKIGSRHSTGERAAIATGRAVISH